MKGTRLVIPELTEEHGIRVSGDEIRVIPERVRQARESVVSLRRAADEADKLASESHGHRRRMLLRAARGSRYRADKIERQCDTIERAL